MENKKLILKRILRAKRRLRNLKKSLQNQGQQLCSALGQKQKVFLLFQGQSVECTVSEVSVENQCFKVKVPSYPNFLYHIEVNDLGDLSSMDLQMEPHVKEELLL